MAEEAENPINDVKQTGDTAKKTAQGAKWTFRAIKVARSFTPAGAALLAKDIAGKLPVVGTLNRQVNNLAKKIVAGAGVGGLGLLLYLLGKLLALSGYVAAGAAIGFALGGPIGAVVGGAISAAVGPQIVSAITSSTNLLQGTSSAITSATSSVTGTIGSAISSVFGSISGALSGAVGGLFGALGGTASFLTSLGGLSLPTSLVVAPITITLSAITFGSLFIGSFVTTGAFFSKSGDASNFNPSQNDYFTVTKTANPSVISNQPTGQVQQVEFTITLTVKGTRLNNIQLSDELNPPISNPAISCPATLDPNATCTQKFIIGVDSSNNDSIITNTVRVTVTPEGKSSVTGAASASITVGTVSASGCFSFQGNWTQEEKDLEAQAINALGRAPAYLNQVCSGGQVILQRLNSNDYNFATCPNIITISNKGVGNQDNTTYTLAHETGHIVQCQGLQSWADFQNAVPWSEGYICSYPLTKTMFEDFAESIAIHVTWKTHVSNACGSINYPTTYPLHYNFTTNLFGGVQF